MHKNTGWLDLWPGFHVTDSRITHESALLRLEPLTKLPLRCGQCLGLVNSVHERITRNVRELPLAGRVLTLQVQLLRVNCTRCGHCLQHVSWLDRFARMTRAMAQTVADSRGRRCSNRPASMQPSKAICLFGGDAFQDHGLDVVGLIWPVSQEFGHLVWRVSHFIFSPMAAACV